MTKAVIWDIGNVMVRWDPRTLYSKIYPDPVERDRFLGENTSTLAEIVPEVGRPTTYTKITLNKDKRSFDGLRFKTPDGDWPWNLEWELVAPDGAVWFNESRQGNMIRFDPKTEHMEVVKIPTGGSVIRNVTVDSARGRLWLAESGVNRLGRIDLK